jgi:hypothetical protein
MAHMQATKPGKISAPLTSDTCKDFDVVYTVHPFHVTFYVGESNENLKY